MNNHSDNTFTNSNITTLSDGTYIRPIYSFIKNDMWRIEYQTKAVFIIDNKQLEKIINCSKRFIFHNQNDTIPTYGINYKRISLLEFFYGVNPYTELYTYKNGDNSDIRTINICFTKPSFYKLTQNYNVIKYLNNEIIVTKGRYAGETKNYMCEIQTTDNKTQYLMLCNQDKICKLCPISYEKILNYEKKFKKKIIWSYQKNGYILGNNNLFIHQIITGCYGNGRGTKNISVDHIDQDPLNNSYDNLRVVSQDVQQKNTKGIKEGTKRARKKAAKPLPDEITEDMVKKYVYYSNEKYGKNNKLRTYFCVCHPKLDKEVSSSKSEKIPILEKLAQANKIVDDLENDIYPIFEEKVLPTFVSNKDYRGKPHLTFDRKAQDLDGKIQRQNLRMVLPEEYDLQEQINILREKIKNKYDFEI